MRAFEKLAGTDAWLVMIGEGELRPKMETFIQAKGLKNVILTGFLNQSMVSEYYAVSDLFVMCSGAGETWGLSTNEAMNFNLPLVLSDLAGCADDLVAEGNNGYTFETGNVDDLAAKIEKVLVLNTLTQKPSSLDIVNRYSYDTITANIAELV